MRISKKEKELLMRAFEAPKPEHKKAFLRKLPKENIGIGSLILSQAAYVRKWVWIVSVLVLLLGAVVSIVFPPEYIWVLSSLAAFISSSLVLEVAKSTAFGMSELEASTRFSLKLILLARVTVIGVVHMVILFLVLPFLGSNGSEQIWQRAVYITVPYLLTAGLGVGAMRICGKKDGMLSNLFGVVSSCGIGIFFSGIYYWQPVIYSLENVPYWNVALLFLIFWFAKQIRWTLQDTEIIV